MRVIIFPYPGQVFMAPLPNDWHTPGIELKMQLAEALFEVYGEHEIVPDTEHDIAIYFDALLRPEHPPMHKKSIYICQEPPVIAPRFYDRIKGWPYTRILTFSRKHCGGNVHYLPFPVPTYQLSPNCNRIDKLVAITANKWSDRPGHLYGVRQALYGALGQDLDLYGHGWDGMPVNWRGPCRHNHETFSQYTKAICIENQYLEGYASEKYWTPLQAGCKIDIHIGWTPDYTLQDCNESGWAKQVVRHVKEVAK